MSDEDWKPLLDDLERRTAAARAMGGAERLARRREPAGSQGPRLDARQRIAGLLDAGSFRELGALVGGETAPADAFVAGIGAIDGRPVLVGAEDFTVQGGSIGLGTHAKRLRLARLAGQERAPLVLLLEGAGERASNALERYPYAPNDLQALAALSGCVPSVAVVMGSSAGHGALAVPLADYALMVEGAALFAAGPPLVAAATGEQVDRETLGGARVHASESGVVHEVVASDAEALALARRYLGYFPSNAWQWPPSLGSGPDTGERQLDGILELIPADPRQAYDARALIALLADAGSVLELQARFGTTVVTALARLAGEPVAVVANQPLVRAGAIDRDGADKAARFLEVTGAFHLPAIFLTDTPGVMVGTAAERAGALRAGARMFAAQTRARGPKLHVTLRKAYGFGSSIMAMNPFDGQTLVLALPGASLAAMPGSGAPPGPWSAAETMAYDEVVDPRELRNALLAGLRLAHARRSAAPEPVARVGIRP